MSAEDGTAVVEPATPTAAPAAEPAATPVDATANAAAEGEGGEGNDGSQERDEHGRFKNPVQPRINELTRAAREAQRERDYWRAIATATTTQAPAPAAPKKPEASEFADYGDYVEALAEFKADEKVAKALSERDERSQRESTAAKVASTWEGRQADFRKSKPDYDDVMAGADGVSIKDHVGQALMDSDHGPAIAYQLAKNPALADKLNALSPTSAARAIGQMEASFAAQAAAPSPSSASAPSASAPAASPAVRTTSAPPPAKTTAAAPSAQVDLSKLSMDDYVKTRKQQGARWAR